MLTPQQQEIHERLNNDLPFFSRHSLMIKTKEGKMEKFVFNDAQLYLHKCLEKQKAETGRVRALILKGRQQGCSTYTAARYYHQTTRKVGKSTFILSHQSDTTEKLFAMVERFQTLIPEFLQPATTVANRRRMVFGELNSEYFVGTAGNDDVGRGGTVQYLHASEAAFYPADSGFTTGLLQSVPDLDDTEVIMESTANGMTNFFYTLCMKALKGEGEYQLIFIPWFWQKEYRKRLPIDFVLTQEEAELKEIYGLDDEQIYWRRIKIDELSTESAGADGESKFKQEYPCNVAEAFQSTGESLVKPIFVSAARKRRDLRDDNGPRIGGLDPGRNRDRSVFVFRQGRVIPFYKSFDRKLSHGSDSQWEMQLAGHAAQFILRFQLDKLFIDCTKGWGTCDRLHELGYNKIAVGVTFSEGAMDDNTYLNKRAEMGCLMAEWFSGEVSCPDDDLFQRDITAMPASKLTSSGLTKLVDKDMVIRATGFSPDIFDATGLTFAYPVRRKSDTEIETARTINKNKGLKTLRRIRGDQPAAAQTVNFFTGRR